MMSIATSAREMKSRFLPRILFFALVVALTFPTAAHAYLDPGSGSMLLQLLLGGTAGLAVLIKLYWQRVLLLFGIAQREDPDEEVRQPPRAMQETDQQG